MVKSIGDDNLSFIDWLGQLNGQCVSDYDYNLDGPIDDSSLHNPFQSKQEGQRFICHRENGKEYTFFSADFSQAMLDCGYSFEDAAKYKDVVLSLSMSESREDQEPIPLYSPEFVKKVLPFIAPQIAESVGETFAQLETPVEMIYDDLLHSSAGEDEKKFGLSVSNKDTFISAADQLLTNFHYLKAEIERLSGARIADPDKVMQKAGNAALWAAAIGTYFKIKTEVQPLHEGKIVNDVLNGIAVALASGDNDEINKAVENAGRLLAIHEILMVKKEMAEHSASPVRAGHVAFKFHYEVTSEESFIPAASLNNTIISKEYQDLLANDPQRAERLEAFLNGVNETERFLQDGRVPSSVAVSADLDLKGTFDPILDMLASLKRESNIEGFLEGVVAKESLAELKEKEDPNGREAKTVALLEYTASLGQITKLSEDLRGDISADSATIAALESVKTGLLDALNDELKKIDVGESKSATREEVLYAIALLDGVALPEELQFRTKDGEWCSTEHEPLVEKYRHALQNAVGVIAKINMSGWVDSARNLAGENPAIEPYIDTVVSNLADDGISSAESFAIAVNQFLQVEGKEPLRKNIMEQLALLEPMLAVAEEVSRQSSGIGMIDHISPIKHTIQLLRAAQTELDRNNIGEADALFLEAVFSPHFEYTMRAAAAEHDAMMILGIKDTAKEVAIVTLAGYVAVGFEAAVAVTRAGTYWGRIKNIYSVVKGVRSISRLNAVREIIQTGGRVLLRNGPRFLRFTAHSAGFHLGSAYFHNGIKGIWDTDLDPLENLVGHGLGTLDMMYTLGSIMLGPMGVDMVLTKTVFAKQALKNLAAKGIMVTEAALKAEITAIKSGLIGVAKWGYRSALLGGEYVSFTFSEGSHAAGKEIWDKGITGADYRYVWNVMVSWQSQWHRLTFLTGLKICHATVGKPVTVALNKTAADTIYYAHRDLFDSYQKQAKNALTHLQRLSERSPDEVSNAEMKVWLGELKDALHARIALKEQLPKFVQDGSILEEKAALAELEKLEADGKRSASTIYLTDKGYVAIPVIDFNGMIRRASIPQGVKDVLDRRRVVAQQAAFSPTGTIKGDSDRAGSNDLATQFVFEMMGAALASTGKEDVPKNKKSPQSGGAVYATLSGDVPVASEKSGARVWEPAIVARPFDEEGTGEVDSLTYEARLEGIIYIIRTSLQGLGRLNASNRVEIEKMAPALNYFFTDDEIRRLTAITDPKILWKMLRNTVFGEQQTFPHDVEFFRSIMSTAYFMSRLDLVSGGRVGLLNNAQRRLLRSSLVELNMRDFDQILPRGAQESTETFLRVIDELARRGIYIENILMPLPDETEAIWKALVEYIERVIGQTLDEQQRSAMMLRIPFLFGAREVAEIMAINPAVRYMAVGDRLLGSAKARSFLEKGVSSEHFINRVIIGMRAFTIFKGVVAMVLPMMSPEQLSSARTFLMHKNLNVFGLVFETLATRLREDPAPLQIISYVLSLMGVSDPVYDELAVGHTIALIVDAIGTESGKQLMTLDKSVYGIRSLHGVLNSYPHGVVADIGRLAEEYPEDIPALLSVIGARSPDDVKRTLVVNDAQNIKKATTLIEDVIEPVIESAFRRVFGIELSGGQLGEIYSRLIGKFTMAELEAISSLNSEISVLFVLHRLGGVDVDGILKAEAEKGGSGSGGKGGVPPADDGFGGGKTKGGEFDAATDPRVPWFLLGESGDTTRGPIPLYAEPLRTISDDEYPEPVRVADAHAVVAKPGDDAGAKPFGGITSIQVEELVRSFFKNANLTFKDEKNISFFVKAVRVFFTDSELIALTKGGDIPPHILAQQLLCSSLDVQMRWDQMLHQIVLVGNFIAAITPRWHTRLPITEGQHMALREALFLDSAADLEAIIPKPGKDGAVQFADILARLDDQGVYLSSAIPIPEETLDNIIKGLIGFVRSIAEPGRIKVNDPRIPSLAEIAPYLFTYLEVDDFFGQVVARGKQFGSEVEFNAAAANAVGRRLCLNSPEPWKGETGKIDRLTILLSVGNVMKVIHSVYSDIMLGISPKAIAEVRTALLTEAKEAHLQAMLRLSNSRCDVYDIFELLFKNSTGHFLDDSVSRDKFINNIISVFESIFPPGVMARIKTRLNNLTTALLIEIFGISNADKELLVGVLAAMKIIPRGTKLPVKIDTKTTAEVIGDKSFLGLKDKAANDVEEVIARVQAFFKNTFNIDLTPAETNGLRAELYSRPYNNIVAALKMQEGVAIVEFLEEIKVFSSLRVIEARWDEKTSGDKGPSGGNIDTSGGLPSRGFMGSPARPKGDDYDASADKDNPLAGMAARLADPWEYPLQGVDKMAPSEQSAMVAREDGSTEKIPLMGSDRKVQMASGTDPYVPVMPDTDISGYMTAALRGEKISHPKTDEFAERLYSYMQSRIGALQTRRADLGVRLSGGKEFQGVYRALLSFEIDRETYEREVVPIIKEAEAILKMIEAFDFEGSSEGKAKFMLLRAAFVAKEKDFADQAATWDVDIPPSGKARIDLTQMVVVDAFIDKLYVEVQKRFIALNTRRLALARILAKAWDLPAVYRVLSSMEVDRELYDRQIMPIIREMEEIIQFINLVRISRDTEAQARFRDLQHDIRNQSTLTSYAQLWDGMVPPIGRVRLNLTPLLPATDVYSAATSAINTFRLLAEANHVEIICTSSNELPEDLEKRRFDETKFADFSRVIHELILNAIKNYSDKLSDGRRVVMEIGVGGEDSQILFVRVKDNGVGMTAAELARYLSLELWRSEKTSDRAKGEGAGSGSIMKILDRFGAYREVKSEEGKGTDITFTLYLPVLEDSSDVVKPDSDLMHRVGNRPKDFTYEGLVEMLSKHKVAPEDVTMRGKALRSLSPTSINKLIIALSNNDFETANGVLDKAGLKLIIAGNCYPILMGKESAHLNLPDSITFSSSTERSNFETLLVRRLGKSPEAINSEIQIFPGDNETFFTEALQGMVVAALRNSHLQGEGKDDELAFLKMVIMRQDLLSSPISVVRLKRIIPPTFRKQFLKYFGLQPSEAIWIEAESKPKKIDFARLDYLRPSTSVATGEAPRLAVFVGAVLDEVSPFAQRYDALSILKDTTSDADIHSRSANAAADYIDAVLQIYGRYRSDLEYILSLEGTARGVSLKSVRPYVFREIEWLIEKAKENSEIDAPYVYKAVTGLSYEAEKAFREVSKESGIPAPPLLAKTASREAREKLYKARVAPLADVYAKKIIPIRHRQNAILPYHGPHTNAHDYLFEKKFGVKWSDAAPIAEAFRVETQGDYEEYLKIASDALGIPVGELRPWDMDYAFEKAVADLSGGRTPTVKVEDAIVGIKAFCKERFGVDLDDPWHDFAINLGGEEMFARVGAGKAYATPSGTKMLMVGFKPGEEISLREWKVLAHEIGHIVHYILGEENLAKETTGLITSSHPMSVAEAFTMLMEDSVYEVAKSRGAEGFTQDYLDGHKRISSYYNVFRYRRAAMLGLSSRVMFDDGLDTFETKRQEVKRSQAVWLGLDGDPDYAFWDPRLVFPDHNVTYLAYVFAAQLLGKMQDLAVMEKTDAYTVFKPLLSAAGTLTTAQMEREGLSISKTAASEASVATSGRRFASRGGPIGDADRRDLDSRPTAPAGSEEPEYKSLISSLVGDSKGGAKKVRALEMGFFEEFRIIDELLANGAEVTAVDNNPEFRRALMFNRRKHLLNGTLSVGDNNTPSGRYQIIVLNMPDPFERPPRSVLAQVENLIAPGGYLIIQTERPDLYINPFIQSSERWVAVRKEDIADKFLLPTRYDSVGGVIKNGFAVFQRVDSRTGEAKSPGDESAGTGGKGSGGLLFDEVPSWHPAAKGLSDYFVPPTATVVQPARHYFLGGAYQDEAPPVKGSTQLVASSVDIAGFFGAIKNPTMRRSTLISLIQTHVPVGEREPLKENDIIFFEDRTRVPPFTAAVVTRVDGSDVFVAIEEPGRNSTEEVNLKHLPQFLGKRRVYRPAGNAAVPPPGTYFPFKRAEKNLPVIQLNTNMLVDDERMWPVFDREDAVVEKGGSVVGPSNAEDCFEWVLGELGWAKTTGQILDILINEGTPVALQDAGPGDVVLYLRDDTSTAWKVDFDAPLGFYVGRVPNKQYRIIDDKILAATHIGLVTSAGPKGVMVRSKWGSGSVMEHPIDVNPARWGDKAVVFRLPKSGPYAAREGSNAQKISTTNLKATAVADNLDWIRYAVFQERFHPDLAEFAGRGLIKAVREQLLVEGVTMDSMRATEIGFRRAYSTVNDLLELGMMVTASDKERDVLDALLLEYPEAARSGGLKVVGEGQVESGQHLVVLNMPPVEGTESGKILEEINRIIAPGGYLVVETDKPEAYIDPLLKDPRWRIVSKPISLPGVHVLPSRHVRNNVLVVFQRVGDGEWVDFNVEGSADRSTDKPDPSGGYMMAPARRKTSSAIPEWSNVPQGRPLKVVIKRGDPKHRFLVDTFIVRFGGDLLTDVVALPLFEQHLTGDGFEALLKRTSIEKVNVNKVTTKRGDESTMMAVKNEEGAVDVEAEFRDGVAGGIDKVLEGVGGRVVEALWILFHTPICDLFPGVAEALVASGVRYRIKYSTVSTGGHIRIASIEVLKDEKIVFTATLGQHGKRTTVNIKAILPDGSQKKWVSRHRSEGDVSEVTVSVSEGETFRELGRWTKNFGHDEWSQVSGKTLIPAAKDLRATPFHLGDRGYQEDAGVPEKVAEDRAIEMVMGNQWNLRELRQALMVLRFSGYSGQAGRVIDMIDSLVVTNKLLIECTDEGRAGRLAAEKDLRNRAFLAELDTLRRSIIQKGDTASSASDAAVFEKETGEWILANCSMRGLKPGVLYLKNIIAKYYGIKPEVLDACIKAVWPEDLPERYLIHTLWLLARNTKSYKQWAFVRDFIKAMASAAERLAETIMTVSEENGFDINLDRANVLAIEHLIKLGDDYEAKNVPVVARHWHFSDYDAVRVILGGIPKRILFQGYSDREREAIDRLGLELAIGLVLPSARLLPDPIRESFLVYVADSQNKVKKDMEGLRNIVSRRMRVYKELLSAADEAIARKKMSDDEKLALRKEAEALIANLTSKQIRVDAIKRRVVEMVRKSRVKKA